VIGNILVTVLRDWIEDAFSLFPWGRQLIHFFARNKTKEEKKR